MGVGCGLNSVLGGIRCVVKTTLCEGVAVPGVEMGIRTDVVIVKSVVDGGKLED